MRNSSSPTSLRLAFLAAVGFAACRAPAAQTSDFAAWQYTADVEVTDAPYDDVHANWKERLAQPYVFREHRGSYTETGRLLPGLHADSVRAGLTISGPPFALFYDDPGLVGSAELRSRVCLPVATLPDAQDMQADVLPAATVAYAVVRGPYPDAPRAYRGILAYMQRFGWVEGGPIREVYLVSPASVATYDALLCEIQIPVRAGQ
ncbi:MAG: GyrI-like domain-containing protein [Planctomycetota bacterium]